MWTTCTARLVFGTEPGLVRKYHSLLGICSDACYFLMVILGGKLYMFFVDLRVSLDKSIFNNLLNIKYSQWLCYGNEITGCLYIFLFLLNFLYCYTACYPKYINKQTNKQII